MRKPAFIILFFLGSLNAASLSSLHIDSAQSHAIQCEPNAPTPHCHAALPHRHDSAHAGEESLFEYIFQVSREAPVLALAFCLVPGSFWPAYNVVPTESFVARIPSPAAMTVVPVPRRPSKSRAPPVSSQA